MSIEYTIDIQLTELGFPDILQLGQSPARETTSHVPTSLPNTHKRTRLSRDDDDDDVAGPASVSSKSATLITSEQYGVTAAKVGAHVGQVESSEDDSDDSEVSGVYEEEEEFDEEGDCEEEATENNDGSQTGNYTCSVCSLQLSSKFKLQDHMNLHTGARPYRCAECGKCFCQNYNYRIHLRTHAQTRVHRILCRVCQMSFASQEDLEEHLLKSHPEKEFYECDLCKRVFTSLMKCQSHVLLHKCMPGIVCEVCGRSFSNPKALARHHRRTCRRSFKCTDCTETFNKKNALLKHSFSHLGLLPYTCVRCRCHFRLAKLYRQHKCQPQLIHCVACLREFLSETDFQQHKKDTGCWGNREPKGDEIRCLECGELFSTSIELKKHAGAHQRILKCAECGKGFRSALLLMSHMGGHAGNAPCLCQSCGLGFLHQQNYDSHLKTCGQIPQPVSASKKHQASKSSSSKTKTLEAKPDISAQTNSIAKPAVSRKPESPVAEPVSPGAVKGDVSSESPSPSDGLWKLSLDKQPPPGVKLVLFLPVCSQTNGLPLSPAIPGHHGLTSTLEGQLNTPPELVTEIKRAECEAPLDLSKKAALSDIPLGHIKNEPGEFEISREADSTKRQGCKSSDSEVMAKTNPGEADTEVMTDRSRLSSSSELKLDIKKEPHGTDIDLLSFKSCQLPDGRTEKEIKVEVDVSNSTDDDDDADDKEK